MVLEYGDGFEGLSREYVLFDLDRTVAGTVFTNEPPLPCMKFYKMGNEGDRRYTVLRPGIRELFERIVRQKGLRIALVTNARRKRAEATVEQFGLTEYVSCILPQQFLTALKEEKQIPDGHKPLEYIGGLCLLDDDPWVYAENKGRCIQVPPFELRYSEDGLEVRDIHEGNGWKAYDEGFIRKEREAVGKWMEEVEVKSDRTAVAVWG